MYYNLYSIVDPTCDGTGYKEGKEEKKKKKNRIRTEPEDTVFTV